jgi:ribose transport system ATP-binding protein
VPAKEADLQQIISLMIGKELAKGHITRTAPAGKEVFRVENLSNPNFAVPISFQVHTNEILGITGLVGSGKTELARAIFGVDPVDSGSSFLAGRPVRIASPRTAIGLGIGYLPEDRDADGLCLNLGVKENVSMVSLTKLRGLFFSRATERRTVTNLVDAIAIRTTGISQQVKYLSGGNKQKVVFGKWLTAECNLLILDEPTIGIDVGARGEIYELIREFVSEGDRAVIFISSDMDEMLEVTDRILVMSAGRLVTELDPRHTTKQEILQHSLQAVIE